MKKFRIAIIGLGLIGGSLARAFCEKLGLDDIFAVDTDEKALEEAIRQGVIAGGGDTPDEKIYSADMIFICTPVRQTFQYIRTLAPRVGKNCIITDVGSTKEEIVRKVNEMADPPLFIGGHPMAGTEKSGFAESYAHMFENAYYILTPCRTTTGDSLETMSRMIKQIGAIPLVLSAEEHDRAAGAISHLPHVVAAALVNLAGEMDNSSGIIRLLAAGGFRDITRIASSNPGLWENISFSNKRHLRELISMFVKLLERFAENLDKGNKDEVYGFFADAGKFRNSLSGHGPGLLQPVCKLYVDVRDKPGVIGEIATILGNRNINIKNINVANSREFEQGCLAITLQDEASANIAFDLLARTGYKVYKNR